MGAPSLDIVAVALADEGVPLRVIARATKISSELLRARLRDAKTEGRLVELPQDDWPPGFPRDQRALQLTRMAREDRGAPMLAMQRLFHLTPTEVTVLLMLLQRKLLFKARLDGLMSLKSIDVHIHRLRRRLSPFGIDIVTCWGCGYQLMPGDRCKVMDLILQEAERGAETRA
jgi:DNA-binding response OmpR family regulator